jgi:hypothetical protein
LIIILNAMRREEIAEFLKKHIEPLPPSRFYGASFRVSVTLKDGLCLPCVVFQNASEVVDFAIKRFDETRGNKSLNVIQDYRAIVRSFVTSGNSLNDYDVREIGISPFAIPLARLMEIRGETSMSWTAFTAVMNDGREFQFGTTFLMEFFEMPDGYTASDIKKIIPAAPLEKRSSGKIYRERPFFTCYIDGI